MTASCNWMLNLSSPMRSTNEGTETWPRWGFKEYGNRCHSKMVEADKAVKLGPNIQREEQWTTLMGHPARVNRGHNFITWPCYFVSDWFSKWADRAGRPLEWEGKLMIQSCQYEPIWDIQELDRPFFSVYHDHPELQCYLFTTIILTEMKSFKSRHWCLWDYSSIIVPENRLEESALDEPSWRINDTARIGPILARWQRHAPEGPIRPRIPSLLRHRREGAAGEKLLVGVVGSGEW